MAVSDLELFIQERVQALDPNRDVGRGSEVDRTLIQPLLRRIGTDPFTVDVRAFLLDLLNQKFPDMPTGDQDGIAEVLVLPMELFLQPIVREIQRLRQNQSLQQPTLLNMEEAEALGGNFFEERPQGERSRVRVRIYYAQPRSVRVTAANVFSTLSGLGYVPTETQSISADNMLFNLEGGAYFFDVNLVAVQPGDQYNVEPNQITQVEGLTGYTRLTNKARAQGGTPESTAEEYVEQIRQSLGEQSMVTGPGVTRTLRRNLPETSRLALVGSGDARMRRDLLQGGSLGPVQFAGSTLAYLGDGEGRPTSRRISINTGTDTGVDFTSLIGPAPLVLTVYGSLVGGAGRVKEVEVRSILSSSSLELEESCIPLGAAGLTWSLRKREIKLLRVPGGILAPDEEGLGTIPADETHVGGMYDVHLRGATLTTQSLSLGNVQDDRPLLEGTLATGANPVGLLDIVQGTHFEKGDSTYLALAEAVEKRWAIQILEGPGAGTYDLLSMDLVEGAAPLVSFYDAPPAALTGVKWRLVDRINIDLLDPKETRVRGSDLQTTQGSDEVTTSSLVDFQDRGVLAGDVLRIQVGLDTEDYVVQEVLASPAYSRLRLDRAVPLTAQRSYSIFRANAAGGLQAPVLRLTNVAIMDSAGAPTGVTVPPATMVGAHVLSLTNPARGEKLEVPDGLLGIISSRMPSGASVSGKLLTFRVAGSTYSVAFAGANPLTVAQIVSQINAAAGFAVAVDMGNRFGLFPYDGQVEVVGSTVLVNSAIPALFGGLYYLTTRMVRSPSFTSTSFTELSPPLSTLYDVVELRSGAQLGAFGVLAANPHPTSSGVVVPAGLTLPTCVLVDGDLFPASDVRLALGGRSLGLLRCSFLEPTTVEVGPQTRFLFSAEGYSLEYQPDPAYSTVVIPAAPSGSKPKEGSVVAASTTFSASMDFVKKRIRPGDVVVVDYKPLVGTVALAEEVVNLAGTQLVFSFGQEATRTLTFVNDDDGIAATSVTRQGVADQINQLLGVTAARIDTGFRLELYPEFLLLVKAGGSANVLLGFSAVSDQNNRSANAGRYTVQTPTNVGAEVLPAFPATETRLQFQIVRPGHQRIGTTQMAQQQGEGGLYYVDLEVVSRGTGDIYNLARDSALSNSGAYIEGYELRTRTPETSFSTEEDVEMVVSRTVHSVGSNDDEEEATPLTGMGLAIEAQGADLVAQAQALLLTDQERDICANPLARALYPHFVHLDLRYAGGPLASELTTTLETAIRSWPPDEPLESSWFSEKTRGMGATSVDNPITLYVVVYTPDRGVVLEKSQNSVNYQGLAAFYPGELRLTRSAI